MVVLAIFQSECDMEELAKEKRKAEEEAAVARKKVEEDVARLVEEHWKDSSIRMSLVRCGTSNTTIPSDTPSAAPSAAPSASPSANPLEVQPPFLVRLLVPPSVTPSTSPSFKPSATPSTNLEVNKKHHQRLQFPNLRPSKYNVKRHTQKKEGQEQQGSTGQTETSTRSMIKGHEGKKPNG